MKKLIIAWVAVAVMAVGLTLAQPTKAGAAVAGPGYCSVSQTPGGFTSTGAYGKTAAPGDSVTQLAKKAYSHAVKAGLPLCSSGVQPHAILQGTGNPFEYVIVLSHDDVIGSIWEWAGGGALALAGWACGQLLPLPWWVSGPVCTAAFYFLGTEFVDYLAAAANQVTWLADYNADFGLGSPQPGAVDTVFGWIYPVHESGLNILLAFPGVPIGLQVNPYAGVTN